MGWFRNKVVEIFKKKQGYQQGGTYLKHGEEDDYPLLVLDVLQNSSSIAMCVETKARITAGRGDLDLNNLMANKEDNYLDILEETSYQLCSYAGFVWKVGFKMQNMAFVPQSVVMPFEMFRFKDASKKVGVMLMYDANNVLKVECELPIFNSVEDALKYFEENKEKENLTMKTFEFYYVDYIRTSKAMIYPRTTYHSVMFDGLAEKELKRAKYRDIRSGFSPRVIATIFQNDEPTEEQEKADEIDFSKFLGSDGATFMVRYAKNENDKIQIDTPKIENPDKMYEYAERSTRENIMRKFGIPNILYGESQAGKLGNSQEFEEAVQYAQKSVVAKEQEMIKKVFKKVFGVDFDIAPFTLQSEIEVTQPQTTNTNDTQV